MASNRIPVTVMLDPDTLSRLDAIKERLGLSISEQLRRGARLWVESREWPGRHRARLECVEESRRVAEGRKEHGIRLPNNASRGL